MVDAISRPQVISISITDIAQARVSTNPVTIPVNGAVYARFQNVTAVPSGNGTGSVSYMKIRALDSMIGRLRAEQESAEGRVKTTELERRQLVLEEVSRAVAEMKNPVRGLVFDTLV